MEDNHRPWGFYENLEEHETHKIKRITVYPGKRLSLQKHMKRCEHWYILQGIGEMTLDSDIFPVTTGDSINILFEQVHRIENKSENDLVFIEIQTGSYFGEDDIVRIEDDFGRAAH